MFLWQDYMIGGMNMILDEATLKKISHNQVKGICDAICTVVQKNKEYYRDKEYAEPFLKTLNPNEK